MHDDTLERTTDGQGAVAAHDLDELRRLDAGNWFSPRFAGTPIPTLDETLDLCLALDLNAIVEIKPCPEREQETGLAVAEAVQAHRHAARCMLSSFSLRSLLAARSIDPHCRLAILAERCPTALERLVDRLDAAELHLDQRDLTAADVERAAAFGLPVSAYTVNDPMRARALAQFGVIAVFSDFPDRIA